MDARLGTAGLVSLGLGAWFMWSMKHDDPEKDDLKNEVAELKRQMAERRKELKACAGEVREEEKHKREALARRCARKIATLKKQNMEAITVLEYQLAVQQQMMEKAALRLAVHEKRNKSMGSLTNTIKTLQSTAVRVNAPSGSVESLEPSLSGSSVIEMARRGDVTGLAGAPVQLLKNARSLTGESPLIVAVRSGNIEFMEALIDQGVDVVHADPRGRTALHYAVSCCNSGWEGLVAAGATMAVDNDGMSPFLRAASAGNVAAVKFFLDKGLGSIDERDRANRGPLSLAARGGHPEMTGLLLEVGADVNEQDDRQGTALHNAAFSGSVETIKVLLREGANINAKTANHNSPLMKAAFDGHVAATRTLLSSGADARITNRWGRTAEQRARDRGHTVLAALLESTRRPDEDDAEEAEDEAVVEELLRDYRNEDGFTT